VNAVVLIRHLYHARLTRTVGARRDTGVCPFTVMKPSAWGAQAVPVKRERPFSGD
jgi:hypothetical protein